MPIELQVIEGKGLAAADLNGFSDPYAVVIGKQAGNPYDSVLGRTKIHKKTLNPVWKEEFKIDDGYDTLTIEVWDHDKVGSDDFLGQIVLNPKSLPESTTWLDLQPSSTKKNKYVKGQISIQARYTAQKEAEKPSGGTHLTLVDTFNQPLDNLPSHVSHLTFGNSFNQRIDTLPKSITHLTFGNDFNQSVVSLPDSIVYLVFGNSFNRPFHASFLPALQHLAFGEKYNHMIDGYPATLTYLKFGKNYKEPITNLPQGLTQLIFDDDGEFEQSIDQLPSSLTRLQLGRYGNKRISQGTLDQLPKSLTHLRLGQNYEQPLGRLPAHITHLEISEACKSKSEIPTHVQVTTH